MFFLSWLYNGKIWFVVLNKHLLVKCVSALHNKINYDKTWIILNEPKLNIRTVFIAVSLLLPGLLLLLVILHATWKWRTNTFFTQHYTASCCAYERAHLFQPFQKHSELPFFSFFILSCCNHKHLCILLGFFDRPTQSSV